MSDPADLFPPEAKSSTRARIVGYAQAAGLMLTNMIKGSVGEQILEAMIDTANFEARVMSAIIRGFAGLDTATDPGDVDPYDTAIATQTPGPGMLSYEGLGRYGTARLVDTFATGTITITNGGASAIFIAPDSVTFTRNTTFPASPLSPTYRNSEDATIYTNPDGTATIGAGGTLDVPIVADEIGIPSNAGAGTVSVTTILGASVTASNAAAIVATAREDADAFRARCRIAASVLSLNGPADAYRFIALGAQKDSDGNVFFFPPFGDGTTAVGIDANGLLKEFPNAIGESVGVNRVYVSTDSSTGNVGVWFASASGDPGATALTDLTALFDGVYWPDTTTRAFHRATEVSVTVDGTVKAKSGAGVSAAVVADAIDAALTAAFAAYDIGGYDQTLGAGTLYKEEIDSTVNGAHAKVYKVTLSSPSGDTALALGEVAVVTNSIIAADVTIT